MEKGIQAQLKEVKSSRKTKSIILSLTIFFLVIPNLCIGGTEIFKVGDGSLFSSCILNRQTYLVVGDLGKVYRTEDGGKNWSLVPTSVSHPLFCIRSINTNTLFISGGNGLILKSINGGRNWKKQNTGTDKQLFSAAFYNEQKGITIGDWGAIFYTEDGGEVWKNVSWKEDKILYGVCYVDSKIVWVVGEQGLILKSMDGGKKWTKQPSPVKSTLTAIDFENKTHGILTGIEGVMYETNDSGNTWQSVSGLPVNHFYNIKLNNKISVCVGDYATVLEKGIKNNWEKLSLPPQFSIIWLSGISLGEFENQLISLIVGGRGLLIKETFSKNNNS